MSPEELKEVLEIHKKWVLGEKGGARAVLAHMDLSGTNLRNIDLRMANMEGVILQDAYLSGANLTGAYMGRANLRYADLTDADMSGADLTDADLSCARLDKANLTDVTLWNANLTGARLFEANLHSAFLNGAYLRDAHLGDDIIQIGPLGSRRDYLIYNRTLDEVRAGCFFGTLKELAEAVELTHGGSRFGVQYRAAIAYIRATGPAADPDPGQDALTITMGEASRG